MVPDICHFYTIVIFPVFKAKSLTCIYWVWCWPNHAMLNKVYYQTTSFLKEHLTLKYSYFSKPKPGHDFADSKMYLNVKVKQNFSNRGLPKSLLRLIRHGFHTPLAILQKITCSYYITVICQQKLSRGFQKIRIAWAMPWCKRQGSSPRVTFSSKIANKMCL